MSSKIKEIVQLIGKEVEKKEMNRFFFVSDKISQNETVWLKQREKFFKGIVLKIN